jgi:hypothetical protein
MALEEIGGGAEEQRRASGLGEMAEGVIQQGEEIGLEAQKERHVAEHSSRFSRRR